MLNRSVLLEPDGLSVPVGSRVAYLFEGQAERTRFSAFIASGLADRDKCAIVTDEQGEHLFREALSALGVDVEKCLRDGSLVIAIYESSESLNRIAQPIIEDAEARFRFLRWVNDISLLSERGWTPRRFRHFEVDGHALAQSYPCTTICQYDMSTEARRHIPPITAAHQYTVVSSSVERSPGRRPRGQIIFDSMGEQLRALTRLQNLSMKLTASLTLDGTLDAIIEAAMTICHADRAAISYINEVGEVSIMRHSGLSEDYLTRRQITRLDPSVAIMIGTREPVIIEDVDLMAGTSPNYLAWKMEGIRSIVTLPLVSEGEVFGIIGAGSGVARRYSQTETDAMAILAAQASAAITNARLFEQLRQANRAKDEFLATLSHELRTPLTPILGWMHILKPFADSDPMLAQGLETIERNASHQAGLINDLLDLTRIISGKIELRREATNLTALVRSTVEQALPQAEARQLQVEALLHSENIVCDLDPVRIRQVVSNLLNNAIKFTPDGGQVTVSLKRDESPEGDVTIEVTDTGIGIEQDFLPYVFERFTQAQSGVNRYYGGLGLGLAISRAMIELHGGKVTASSEGLGRGSRFTVRLPASCQGAEPARQDYSIRFGGQQEYEPLGLDVLVIEDSLDTVEMLRLWLEGFGCSVRVATESIKGLMLASERRPDLIISDIGMPGLDGYELINKLRAIRELEQVPAIALTGYAREEDRELALAAGYTAHLAKPAEMSSLYHLIKKTTGRD